METSISSKPVTFDDVFQLSVDGLKQEMERLAQETKGICKLQLKRSLAKLLSQIKAHNEELKMKG